MRWRRLLWLVVVALPAGFVLTGTAAARSSVARVGPARFEVLTPTLIRLEYAQDHRFENRPTMTATRARLPVPHFVAHRSHGWLTITTRSVVLRYRLGSGPFTAGNLRLTLDIAGRRAIAHPTPDNDAGNLGGWRRALDMLDGPVRLNDGLLSRAGWYVLDDTDTVLLTHRSPGFAVRPRHYGPYQDWYLFAYGHDYARGLEDLRALTGPTPLLPRSAFGVWFSRYWPYSEQDYHNLLAQFRANRVPLDTLSIDTDFKRESDPAVAPIYAAAAGAPGRPYAWDGWEWDATPVPRPQAVHRLGPQPWAVRHAERPSVDLRALTLSGLRPRRGLVGCRSRTAYAAC